MSRSINNGCRNRLGGTERQETVIMQADKKQVTNKDLQTYILAVAFQANNPSADTKPYKKPPIVDILRKERQMS
jgi:predicted type IV restriction endonuclease